MSAMLESTLRLVRAHAFTILIFCYILFVIAGGIVFMVLEQPDESSLTAEVRALRAMFLDRYSCVRERSLDSLLEKVLYARKRGVVLGSESDKFNFDFTSSLFFVITFLTTTGYGTTMPLSDEGRVFCMLYCLFGIPLTFLLLSSAMHALLPWVTHTPVRHLHTFWGLPPGRAGPLYAALLAGGTASVLFLLPAVALCLLKPRLSFLESLYYCFTSLSTIGLAGYLPGQTHSRALRQGLEFATSCYLLLGLVVLMVVLETFWELPQVQMLVRLFTGPWNGELKGFDLDQLVLGADSGSPGNPEEELKYSLPISIISPSLTMPPLAPTPEPTDTEMPQSVGSPGSNPPHTITDTQD